MKYPVVSNDMISMIVNSVVDLHTIYSYHPIIEELMVSGELTLVDDPHTRYTHPQEAEYL
jgi:hypothetical protein